MPYQTLPQKKTAFKLGSAMIELSSDGISWLNLGVGNKISFSDKYTPVQISADNGGVVAELAKDQECELKMNLQEIDMEVMSKVRGGIDDYSTIAGTPVSITGEAHGTGWTQGKPIKLTYKNGDNTVVSSITVKGGGSTLALNTDYRVYVSDGSNGEKGYTYVVPITSQAGAITVDYTYTPNAAKILKSGGGVELTANMIRLTNTNAAGKIFQITVYQAFNQDGFKFDLPADDDPKFWETSITFKGTKDATRSLKDQLYFIRDEQSTV